MKIFRRRSVSRAKSGCGRSLPPCRSPHNEQPDVRSLFHQFSAASQKSGSDGLASLNHLITFKSLGSSPSAPSSPAGSTKRYQGRAIEQHCASRRRASPFDMSHLVDRAGQIVWSPTPQVRAASVRDLPSWIAASARKRRVQPCRGKPPQASVRPVRSKSLTTLQGASSPKKRVRFCAEAADASALRGNRSSSYAARAASTSPG